MKTFNVVITDPTYFTAMSFLPPMWVEDGVRYCRHETLKTQVIDGAVVSNADLVITRSIEFDQHPLGLRESWVFTPTVTHIRYDKSKQNALVNKLATSLGCVKYHPVSADTCEIGHVLDADSDYILKPANGARGIGNILFNTKSVSLETLRRAIASYSPVGETTTAGFVKHLKEHAPKAQYVSVRDKHEGEGVIELRSEYIAVKYVPNIVAEYRIITDAVGAPIYAIKRARNTVATSDVIGEYKQGCGNNETPSSALLGRDDIIDALPKEIQQDVIVFFNNIDVALHAFDLFVTGTDGRYRWGIFEVSPDFGFQAVPNQIIQAEAKTFIRKIMESNA